MDYTKIEAVDIGIDFENFLETEYPSLSDEQRIDLGRKLTEFVETKHANEQGNG